MSYPFAPLEPQAFRAALRPLCDFMMTVGSDKKLQDYQEHEALELIRIVVYAYQKKMLEMLSVSENASDPHTEEVTL